MGRRPRAQGRRSTLAALKSIRAARPGGYRLFVILDNLSANKTPAIRRWAGRENVELCFTPVNASWANPRRNSGQSALLSWAALIIPAMFVAAWRHVVRLFRAVGAANVTWLWTVNSIQGESSSLSQWWPGAAWVNWTGIAGYYSRATDTFSSVFGSTIADIRAFSSAPLLISETAVGTTTDRESQIDALFAGVRAERPAGVVWFDAAQHAGLYHQDWRLEDDPYALAAFTTAVATNLGR